MWQIDNAREPVPTAAREAAREALDAARQAEANAWAVVDDDDAEWVMPSEDEP